MLQGVKSHNFIICNRNCSKNSTRTKTTKMDDLIRTTTNCNISGYLQMEFLDRPSMRQPTLYFVCLLMLTLAAHSIGHWLLSATFHLPFAARDNWYDSVSGTNVEYLPWQSLWTSVRGGVVSQVLTIFIGINHVNLTGYIAVNTRVVSVLYSHGWNQS
jgi:ABC-type Fe3+ transport system permease subunit